MVSHNGNDSSESQKKELGRNQRIKAKPDTIICECGLDTLFPITLLNRNMTDHYCWCGKLIAKAVKNQVK